MLRVEGLSARYGEFVALEDVSFAINAGDFALFLGRNGVGKSTLLRAISGVGVEASGEMWLGDGRLDSIAPHRRARKGIAHVPEGRRPFKNLTVLENLQIGQLASNRAKRVDDGLDEALDLFPRLRERLKQKAGTLSGGEQQMLVIGRGLMSDPEILMLDEPSLGLAPIVKEALFAQIKRVRERRKMTIIMAEQEAITSIPLATRIFLMDRGRLVREFAPGEVDGRDIVHQYLTPGTK